MAGTVDRAGYQHVELPQGRVRYRDIGEGPPIVFLHALFVNGAVWRKVVPLLSADYRCIVPDLPLGGHVPALKPDADLSLPGLTRMVADMLVALDLRDVTLVGNDTGGGLSQLVITSYPERVARMVLTNCDAYENWPPPILAPIKLGIKIPGFVTSISKAFRFVPSTGLLFHKLVAHTHPGQDVLDGYFGPLIADPGVRRDVTKMMQQVTPRYILEAAKSFPSIDKPVLIVWGEDDRVFPREDAIRLANDFPNARLEFVPDSRAFVAEDQPERLAELMREFLAAPAERDLAVA